MVQGLNFVIPFTENVLGEPSEARNLAVLSFKSKRDSSLARNDSSGDFFDNHFIPGRALLSSVSCAV